MGHILVLLTYRTHDKVGWWSRTSRALIVWIYRALQYWWSRDLEHWSRCLAMPLVTLVITHAPPYQRLATNITDLSPYKFIIPPRSHCSRISRNWMIRRSFHPTTASLKLLGHIPWWAIIILLRTSRNRSWLLAIPLVTIVIIHGPFNNSLISHYHTFTDFTSQRLWSR